MVFAINDAVRCRQLPPLNPWMLVRGSWPPFASRSKRQSLACRPRGQRSFWLPRLSAGLTNLWTSHFELFRLFRASASTARRNGTNGRETRCRRPAARSLRRGRGQIAEAARPRENRQPLAGFRQAESSVYGIFELEGGFSKPMCAAGSPAVMPSREAISRSVCNVQGVPASAAVRRRRSSSQLIGAETEDITQRHFGSAPAMMKGRCDREGALRAVPRYRQAARSAMSDLDRTASSLVRPPASTMSIASMASTLRCCAQRRRRFVRPVSASV